MSVEKKCGCYVPTCDYCGSKLMDCASFKEAVQAFKDNGWKVRRRRDNKQFWENICVECQEYERSLKE